MSEAANALFWISVALLGSYWLWGVANPLVWRSAASPPFASWPGGCPRRWQCSLLF